MKRKAAVDYFGSDGETEKETKPKGKGKGKRAAKGKGKEEEVKTEIVTVNDEEQLASSTSIPTDVNETSRSNCIDNTVAVTGEDKKKHIDNEYNSAAKDKYHEDAEEDVKVQKEAIPAEQVIDPVALQQYQMYQQQYQQYYAQYYTQYYQNQPGCNVAAPAPAPINDPIYEHYTATPSIPTSGSFDSSRASRQMSAYFDPNKFHAVLSPDMQAAQQFEKQKQQSRLTAKDIEAFKKRKAELKKKKNQWLYE